MPMAIPRLVRWLHRATGPGAPTTPAPFVTPAAVDAPNGSVEDRGELHRIRWERREALARARRSDAQSWRDAP